MVRRQQDLHAATESCYSRPMETRACIRCGGMFKTARSPLQVKYCGRACARAASNDRYEWRTSSYSDDVPSGTVGAIHELIVCADLLAKGYHVFRAVSPSCPCDLVVVVENIAKRIEVRTAYRHKSGSVFYPRKNKDADRYDYLALVFAGKEIIYKPPLTEKEIEPDEQ